MFLVKLTLLLIIIGGTNINNNNSANEEINVPTSDERNITNSNRGSDVGNISSTNNNNNGSNNVRASSSHVRCDSHLLMIGGET